jgi:hypothetical protein
MWTPPALASELRPLGGTGWRVVESQSRVATMKIVDTASEQDILEAELERSKPLIPAECGHLHWLLATPFRYAPYPQGSRFRRARQREGCLYAAERAETAVAEAAFYLLLFTLDAPGAVLPRNPRERSAFSFRYRTSAGLDLRAPPLVTDAARWTDPVSYEPCQALADAARQAKVDVLRYASVRDPAGGSNIAVLDCGALVTKQPTAFQTWHLMLRPDRVEAVREMPRTRLSFLFSAWAAKDPRIPQRLP